MYTFLKTRQLITYLKRLYAVEVGKSSDGVTHIHKDDEVLERKYYLETSTSIDAVYFNGMSKDNDALVCGVARRKDNICEAFLYLKINGEDLLLMPSMPDTRLEQSLTEAGEYHVQGIKITNFIPMRTWQLCYNGEMKPRGKQDQRVKVEMALTWSAWWPPFNYDSMMAPESMASDMAREHWSKDYFKLLKKFHQTHYEQMGFLRGTVKIDGKEYDLNMPAVRDHTFGSFRDWHTFHRYVLHFIFLDNGDCMAIGSVSQPAILSHLTIGYLCRHADQTVLPVKWCDYRLYHHGENKIMPKDYGFVFKAGNQEYAVKVNVEDEDANYFGNGRIAKIYERWSSVEVNGVKGRACVECQFNNVQKD
ncbi:hypothetical protein O3G_MSEX002301 [Manduca sexta]|uniref:Uncharacterized protein n=2 Tax=Manduca sexta TaxID=7130 RepID=A0A922CE00_MANSE|nr:hypothetical protein O3G_MSEX002301 [Manduca sexta]